MDKIARVRAALRGEVVDRPPYGFWTHLPEIDLDPVRLADETASFARRFDIDFVKSMPNGLFVVEDFGVECDFSEIARGGVAKVTRAAVQAPEDWLTLRPCDVEAGAYGRELAHLRRLVKAVGPDQPVLATVFSPLTVAAKMSNGLHRQHLRSHPDMLHKGLAAITETAIAFARAALAAGCAGIFFAIQDAMPKVLTEAEYRAFGTAYDLRVLAAAQAAGGWFNVVHMHGEDMMFDLIKGYPAAALNWHIGETPPSIAAYRQAGGTKPVLGGLQRAHLTDRSLPAIRADLDRTIAETGGRGVLVAPACVIRHPVDADTLLTVAGWVKGLAKGG